MKIDEFIYKGFEVFLEKVNYVRICKIVISPDIDEQAFRTGSARLNTDCFGFLDVHQDVDLQLYLSSSARFSKMVYILSFQFFDKNMEENFNGKGYEEFCKEVVDSIILEHERLS